MMFLLMEQTPISEHSDIFIFLTYYSLSNILDLGRVRSCSINIYYANSGQVNTITSTRLQYGFILLLHLCLWCVACAYLRESLFWALSISLVSCYRIYLSETRAKFEVLSRYMVAGWVKLVNQLALPCCLLISSYTSQKSVSLAPFLMVFYYFVYHVSVGIALDKKIAICADRVKKLLVETNKQGVSGLLTFVVSIEAFFLVNLERGLPIFGIGGEQVNALFYYQEMIGRFVTAFAPLFVVYLTSMLHKERFEKTKTISDFYIACITGGVSLLFLVSVGIFVGVKNNFILNYTYADKSFDSILLLVAVRSVVSLMAQPYFSIVNVRCLQSDVARGYLVQLFFLFFGFVLVFYGLIDLHQFVLLTIIRAYADTVYLIYKSNMHAFHYVFTTFITFIGVIYAVW